MWELINKLWPIHRSITGKGIRASFNLIKQYKIPTLTLHNIPSGTKVFDWTVPPEWNVNSAYISDLDGNILIDIKDNNLHIVSYSTPVDSVISNVELQDHLYSLPDLPDAIPYVTSYYQPRWGFCLSHNQRLGLTDAFYKVHIDSQLFQGSLTYSDAILEGNSQKEILFSSYLCHPSMANNELSGPVVLSELYTYISSLPIRNYTYRFVLAPETIGSVSYIYKNLTTLKSNVFAAFNLTCLGDPSNFSFIPSRCGETISDRAVHHLLRYYKSEYTRYSWSDRGSDERQYCSPGVDLPMCTIMRSKFASFKEYHTSLDDLNFVTKTSLEESYNFLVKLVDLLESNLTYKALNPCEPMLCKYNLYNDISTHDHDQSVRILLDLLSYSDGTLDLLSIADILAVPYFQLLELAELLHSKGLIKPIT